MNERQKALIEKIKLLLKPELLSDHNLLTFFGHIDVEIWPLRHVERDLISSWMPPSNQIPKVLFRLLRDRVGGHARVRGSFTANSLRESLAAENVFLMVPPDMSSLRDAVRACGAQLRQHKYTIAATGKHIPRSIVGDIVTWAQQSPAEEQVAMLLDQAGMGKTVVMRDVLSALENKGVVLAVKVDQQLSGITHYEDLKTKLHLPDSPEHVVGRLAALEPVVVLIDQIDALSLSLARDQAALNIVLEFVARLRLIPGVRILLSCRTFDRNSDPRLKRLEISREFPLAELPDAEIQDILQAMGIDASMLSEPMHRLLRVPLHVDLFVRAIEGQTLPATYGDIQGIASLQDLYALLWRNVILKRETDSPPEDERIEVLWRMTERMNRDQQTSVSQSLFTAPETVYLQPAVHWLASEGILISSETEWSFLHQTFFDYCYAKHFVESGGHLTEAIMQSDQGLFARPQLIQVLAYLRGSAPRTYIQELDHLFKTPQLRIHLQDLVLRWFGALPNPTDDEWVVARRMLANPATRPKLLATIQRNRGWFDRLAGKPLLELLSKDDQTLDTQVLPYLASLIDVAQAQVIGILEPYIHRSEQWNNRVAWLVSVIQSWRTQEAVYLLKKGGWRL